LPELSAIKHRVISSQIGWLKPSPRFFEAVIFTAACPAAEIAFVGDDRINDYTGANAAGMRAVLFDPRPEEMPGVVRIRRLAELLS
jgi:putative hydrolase of the HAD superfamily